MIGTPPVAKNHPKNSPDNIYDDADKQIINRFFGGGGGFGKRRHIFEYSKKE